MMPLDAKPPAKLSRRAMMERILSHADNSHPITPDWLRSIQVFTGETSDGKPTSEHEATIRCEDVRKAVELTESYGDAWEEVTVIGHNIETGETYIEVYGGDKAFSVKSQEVIALPRVTTRLEFRLLLLSLKAWGYNGE